MGPEKDLPLEELELASRPEIGPERSPHPFDLFRRSVFS
jgi:hypothetical protein